MQTGMASWLLASIATTLVVAGPQQPAPQPTLATVLERAAAYVAQLQQRLSGVVVEEHYVQDWYAVYRRPASPRHLEHRELRSDLVLMQVGSDTSWTEFRDVFEVDGRTIRPRNARLETLLRATPGSVPAQVPAILAESARFNIGDVDRNVNTPLFSLRFLEAANQSRFRFRRRPGDVPRTPAPVAAPADSVFRVSTEVWEIAYEETQSRTIIRSAQRRDQPAHGRFWIEPATGRVLVSELIVDDRSVRATIDVSFQSEPLLEMSVPVAMRERYVSKESHSLLEGRATYGQFHLLGQ